MKSKEESTIRCTCGQVEIRLLGKPILTAVCHCDDCQRASSELELLPNAPKILDIAGGTAYVLYRKDRVLCTKGKSFLHGHLTEGEQYTTRAIASCCDSPMYLDEVCQGTHENASRRSAIQCISAWFYGEIGLFENCDGSGRYFAEEE